MSGRTADGREKSSKGTTQAPLGKSAEVVDQLKPEQTVAATAARMMVKGLGMNAVTAAGYSKQFGDLDIVECIAALRAQAGEVQSGNLASLEATLTAQAVTLNAMFTQLAYETSKMNIVDQIDRFTRLALKAQGQCRATIETLALMKNPPAVFARQANIAHGPQQVNNAGSPEPKPPPRAENQKTERIELLESRDDLDLGTTSTTSAGDPAMATVGPLNRPTNG